MAQASRRLQYLRRLKRQVTLTRRATQQLTRAHLKHYQTLLTILAQQGGEVTIVKGTAEQVARDIRQLSYTYAPGHAENELIIRLVTTVTTVMSSDSIEPMKVTS